MEIYIEEYLQYMQGERKVSSNTGQAYRSDLYKLCDFLKTNSISDWNRVTIINLNSYILFLEKNNIAAATVSRNISSIKSFFAWMFRARVIDNEPSVNLKHPRVEQKTPDVLTKEELERLYAAMDMNTPKGIRDNAILRMLCATGIRTQELLELNVNDVNLITESVMITTGGHERVIGYDDTVRDALAMYINNVRGSIDRSESSVLFLNMHGQAMSRQGLWKMIKGYGDLLGITITPQVFRHTCAANMAAGGGNIESLRRMLGVTNLSAIEKYSDYVQLHYN